MAEAVETLLVREVHLHDQLRPSAMCTLRNLVLHAGCVDEKRPKVQCVKRSDRLETNQQFIQII